MVSSGYRTMNLRLTGANRSAHKNPIDRSPMLEERARRCRRVLICKCVLKLSAADCRSSRPIGHIEIEVAGKQNRRVAVVSPRIVQGFVKLGTAQLIIASAFQVQVVGDYRFA